MDTTNNEAFENGYASGKTDESRKNETRNISEFNPVDGFKCEKCGIDLRDWSRIVFDEDADDEFVHEYDFNFCPNCGKRVVE